MAYDKVSDQNFNQAKIMLFTLAVNNKMLKFLEFIDVIYQFYECYEGYN